MHGRDIFLPCPDLAEPVKLEAVAARARRSRVADGRRVLLGLLWAAFFPFWIPARLSLRLELLSLRGKC